MKNTSKFTRYYPVIFVIVVVLLSLACGSSTTKKLSDAAQKPKKSPTATKVQADSQPSSSQPEKKGQEPTITPEPTPPPATPTPKPASINLVAQGFGQDGRHLGYAFLVGNPNQGFAVEDAQYQIAAYNDAGTVVETDSGFISFLLPNQTLGVGGNMILDEGVTASKVEIQLKASKTQATEPIPNFKVDKVTYFASGISSFATGIINSPYNRDMTQLRVSSVAYDKSGNIIGGGFTFLNFIPANGTTGVKTSLTSSGNVAKVELYPTLSGLSMLSKETNLPVGASDLVLVKQGFGQDKRRAGFGLLIENKNDSFAVDLSLEFLM